MEYGPIKCELASENLFRIAKRIQLMELFYKKLQHISTGLEDYLNGHGYKYPAYQDETDMMAAYFLGPTYNALPMNFKETMYAIGGFLKSLNGEELSREERDNFTSSKLPDSISVKYGLNFDNIVEPYILWLYKILNQCRKVHSMISIYLENLYSPEGVIATEAKKRYYETAAKQKKL